LPPDFLAVTQYFNHASVVAAAVDNLLGLNHCSISQLLR